MSHGKVLDSLLGSLRRTLGEEKVDQLMDRTKKPVRKAVDKEVLFQILAQLPFWRRVAFLCMYLEYVPGYLFREKRT